MTALEALAGFVHDFDPHALSAKTLDRLELHLLDTVGAIAVGQTLDESRLVRRLAAADDVLTLVASARATEMDDIHLRSCTTPGSVVVGTALALVRDGAIATPDALLTALAVGYETTIRTGLAIDGPEVLNHGVWPTLFAAPVGSAAVTSRALGLSFEQTAGALATALALTSGTPTRSPRASSSRWMTLGAAAGQGVLAGRGAAHELGGASSLLEQLEARIAGVAIDAERLVADYGDGALIDELCSKPHPVARQALAAIEACRELGIAGDRAGEVDEVVVAVPEQQRRIIDRPEIPETRLASIVSAQYLVALALVAPKKLDDVRRTPPFVDDAVRALMTRVRVEADPELARHYPDAWPARISVRRGSEWVEREILHPMGDAERELSWDQVRDKYRAHVSEPDAWRRLATAARSLHASKELPPFEIVLDLGD